MKKTLVVLIVTLNALSLSAQEEAGKFKMHAANIGFGIFHVQKNSNDGGGVCFLADATFAIDKNLLSVSYLTGEDLGILGESEYGFNELSLLYGREYKPVNWFAIEGFAGIGYYDQKTVYTEPAIEDLREGSSVSFPLRLNTKFYFGGRFGMGFNANYSINSVNNNLAIHLLFHYKIN